MDSTQDPGLVYVIDDDAAMRRTLGSIVAAHGLDHHSYESAELFLHKYVDRGPACILSDIRMPGMTGLQMLDRLHEMGVRHPVVFMTCCDDVETAVRCFRHGAADFFQKPADPAALVARLREMIERDRSQRQHEDQRRVTLAALETLSPRERQVLDMLFSGRSNKAIAHELTLSEKTIAAHRAHILEKMHTESLPLLVRALMTADLEAQHAEAA